MWSFFWLALISLYFPLLEHSGLFPPGGCELFMPFILACLYLSHQLRVNTCMGDRQREIQYPSQQRRLGGGQIAPLAVILNAHRLTCFRAALPGTENPILFAFSVAGGAHAHQRQASGSLRKPCFNQRSLAQTWLQHVTGSWNRQGQGQLHCAQPQDLPALVPGQKFLLMWAAGRWLVIPAFG